MGELYVGTCSWKYPSWEGLVYSSREPRDFLAEYARAYRTVEVDQWFWSLGKTGAALPRKETVAEYDAATPPGFLFTVKCPDALTLTHHRASRGTGLVPNGLFLDPGFFFRFLEAIAPLAPKIGLLMFQFEYLNKQKMESRERFADELSAFLDALPADVPYGVEIRNPRWMDDAWFEALSSRGVAPVLLQGYWMDDVAGILDARGGLLGNAACVRLHGEDREGMEERTGADWSRIVRPKDEELSRIMRSVDAFLSGGRKVFLNVNNHFEGSAPLTISKILGRS
ncbi:MAG: DUF72 domain-containing protein [Spirochaetes bacterium]|nr:DUF72 domain-containing protein [Spirochaetota bacterium]MBU1080100.1 DUF72 domain-containing protein [Spirochaetota bacterium]